ncbi:MAG: FeoB-associated Cys-rich membrane protein [Oscillospiraceae bacterium]|nr:FeoB-associated Cys-rich membrane protein [Oscillospiraceae bacterium]MBQ7816884.1 FeoB-associated Cys-rich membrane protein [Oscillospiraceae bacterium]
MTDIIVIAIVLAIVGSASAYIYKEKKKGVRCVGCSHAGQCGKMNSGCGCQGE